MTGYGSSRGIRGARETVIEWVGRGDDRGHAGGSKIKARGVGWGREGRGETADNRD